MEVKSFSLVFYGHSSGINSYVEWESLTSSVTSEGKSHNQGKLGKSFQGIQLRNFSQYTVLSQQKGERHISIPTIETESVIFGR